MELKRRHGKEFTREECYELLKRYDKQAYEYYTNNAWYFGCDARRYAAYLYAKNYLAEMFDKYHVKHERIGESDAYRVYGNFDGFSSVRITYSLIELDGKIVDEEDFERWCTSL